MEPTLTSGAVLVVDKTAKVFGEWAPAKGDIVVFAHPDLPRYTLVKRVVASSGDTLEMRDGKLHLNGSKLEESYVRLNSRVASYPSAPASWHRVFLIDEALESRYTPTRTDWGPIVVPSRAYFVLGDNRSSSGDSRGFGYIDHKDLQGRPLLKLR